MGLVAAGVEKFTVYGLPFTEKLKLLGKCQLIEQRNEAMNRFIAELFGQLNKNGIDALLVKGQGRRGRPLSHSEWQHECE